MASQTTQLLLSEDLEDDETISHLLAENRQAAVLSVSRWVRDFIACPHRDLGRDGTVCPFIQGR